MHVAPLKQSELSYRLVTEDTRKYLQNPGLMHSCYEQLESVIKQKKEKGIVFLDFLSLIAI